MSTKEISDNFSHIRKNISAASTDVEGAASGVPKFDFVQASDLSSRRLDLSILLPDELMNRIFLLLQDEKRIQDGVDLLEEVTKDLSDTIYNSLIDLTQIRQLAITLAARVTGYRKK